ncbi:hypothetical protein QMZ92_34355 [Streptomyces sp. HNM0645]|uniref:hypothetical protein n=1 Tax=Streptomyces sp. HNM0645 TaxID=2782343 RepID=UPI0024B657F9|nr:hypothetical protein [Streptomyces sp. HNM0645]MDI9889270.1 hypothetical protein [Streptomyces sp. HNM0645]
MPARLLSDLADATDLTNVHRRAAPTATARHRSRPGPDRSGVGGVSPADGGEAIADLALLRDQAEVFGPVASNPTAWLLRACIDPAALGALRAARTTACEVAW